MTHPFITEEAVKAGGKAIYERRNGSGAKPFHHQPKSYQQEYIADVLAALPYIEKAVREDEREKCAATCNEQERVFRSPEYAGPNPIYSLKERFACAQIAAAIRARKE